MTDPFVPFAPDRAGTKQADSAFRVVILPQTHAAAPAFVPTSLGTVPHAHSPDAALDPGHPSAEPEIQLDREGDRITRITVRCSCGQVIELNCTY